jgi:hypothetical protein
MKNLILLLAMAFVLQCCKHNPVDAPQTNPREYTWTIDTLAYPGSYQTAMRDIWGSSPSDVYVVGHNDRSKGLMWHYDGQQWLDVKLGAQQGGLIWGAIDLLAVCGLGTNNVFAVGAQVYENLNPPPNILDSSLVIQNLGQQWRELRLEGGRNLCAAWLNSAGNIWVGGWMSCLYKFDGSAWRKEALPVTVENDGFFQINAIEGNSHGDLFATGYTHYNSTATTIYYFFRRFHEGWAVVDSFFAAPGRIENKWGYGDLWMSPSGTLYSCGAGVFRWNGSNWEKLFDFSSYMSRITGTSDQNIFVVGHFGNALHFDGVDWHKYQEINYADLVYSSVWTDEREVFVVGFTTSYPQETVILHGK